jgi:hypothetical protein
VSVGDGFQDPPMDNQICGHVKTLIYNGVVVAYTLCTSGLLAIPNVIERLQK